MDILNILEPVKRDESITRMQVTTYNSYHSTALNRNDEIRIPMQYQSTFAYIHESYIYIEGKLTNINPADVTQVPLLKNFLLHFFSEIRLEINGSVLEKLTNPGVLITMKQNLLHSPADMYQSSEMGQILNNNVKLRKNEEFSMCIPLKNIFGFAEHYKKIVTFSKLELILIRSRNENNAVYIERDPAIEVEFTLTKVQWKVPLVQVNDVYKLKLLKILESGRKIYMPFRKWELHENPQLLQSDRITWQVKTASLLDKPQFVIVGFQTAKKDSTSSDNSKFDHCNLMNAKLYISSQQYPNENLDLNFETNKYSIGYKNFCDFQSVYFNKPRKSSLTLSEFKEVSPLISFDCSKTESDVKITNFDVSLHFEFRAPIPANTACFCIIIHDSIISYNPYTNVVEYQA